MDIAYTSFRNINICYAGELWGEEWNLSRCSQKKSPKDWFQLNTPSGIFFIEEQSLRNNLRIKKKINLGKLERKIEAKLFGKRERGIKAILSSQAIDAVYRKHIRNIIEETWESFPKILEFLRDKEPCKHYSGSHFGITADIETGRNREVFVISEVRIGRKDRIFRLAIDVANFSCAMFCEFYAMGREQKKKQVCFWKEVLFNYKVNSCPQFLHMLHHTSYEKGKLEPTFGLMMEYCEEGSLDNFYKRNRLFLGNRIGEVIQNLLIDCIKGLCFLEKMRIRHRGIEPGNIQITFNEEKNRYVAKIENFSLATHIENEKIYIEYFDFNGPFKYFAPEYLFYGATYIHLKNCLIELKRAVRMDCLLKTICESFEKKNRVNEGESRFAPFFASPLVEEYYEEETENTIEQQKDEYLEKLVDNLDNSLNKNRRKIEEKQKEQEKIRECFLQAISNKADLWGLGVSFLQLFYDNYPFCRNEHEMENPANLLIFFKNATQSSIDQLVERIDKSLILEETRNLLKSILQINYKKRPLSSTVLQTLNTIIQGGMGSEETHDPDWI